MSRTATTGNLFAEPGSHTRAFGERLLKLLAYLSLLLSCLALPAHAWQSAPAADSGKIVLSVRDTRIATDDFIIRADGSSQWTEVISLGSNPVTLHSQLAWQKGRLVSVTSTAAARGSFTLTLQPRQNLVVNGKPVAAKPIPAQVLPYADMAPHLFSYAVAALKTPGPVNRQIRLLASESVGPAGPVTLFATMKDEGAITGTVNGKPLATHRYSVVLAGPIGNIDTTVTTDVAGHVLMWQVPGQSLTAIRIGYEELEKPAGAAAADLSQPTFTVTRETDVKVPMRDGVLLAADIYRPAAPGRYPAILSRTPYGRTVAGEGEFYARRGYVYVSQDTRGRGNSTGVFRPFVDECDDGYDSIEWLAKQPWCDGRVGMIGASYGGFVQWAAASENSPHLKCIVPIVSPPDPFFNVPYAFGALFLAPDLWWLQVVDQKVVHIPDPLEPMRKLVAHPLTPLSSVDKLILGHTSPQWQEWLKHSTNDTYWKRGSFDQKLKSIGPLPALNVSGWFDGDGIGTRLNYAAMIASGHANQRLIYGPWSHELDTTTHLGPYNFGPQSIIDLNTLYLRWFDRWLKGVHNGITHEPPVKVFLMGANQWRDFAAWPPRRAVETRFYLHSSGHANSDHSNGTLTRSRPAGAEPPDRYRYDPSHPYISPALKRALAAKGSPQSAALQRPYGTPTVLVYTTAPLTHDLTVAGPVDLTLEASSTAVDTDWYASLSDVQADGREAGLVSGVLRASFRNSSSAPKPLVPGKVTRFHLNLWALGMVFPKGHRLRVAITSSGFPTYDRNLDTGSLEPHATTGPAATESIYHTKVHASYLSVYTLP
ncbi:MAG: CocE/NonD family hydrolase [Armatimonadetes bacterium]|nr:CocE/NonD family hydrolase [Armatimonadota bacterium]MDE2206204.1 CocE/NonD family hydrolase [Armatimonadota bacterium]